MPPTTAAIRTIIAGFAEGELAVYQLSRLHDDEERVPAGLDLGALMRVMCILHREVVQADPDERVGLLQHVADRVEADVAVPTACRAFLITRETQMSIPAPMKATMIDPTSPCRLRRARTAPIPPGG